MANRKLFRSEMIGAIFIIIVGSLLHFCFDWSGGFKPLALFCAVNESTWEHMKIGFWPAFFYGLYQYFTLEDRPATFILAKTLALYLFSITIPVIFYSYKAIVGDNILIVDILIFIFAAFLSQYICYRIMTSQISFKWDRLVLICLVIIILSYSLFTYFPPELELFKDPKTGSYGIISEHSY